MGFRALPAHDDQGDQMDETAGRTAVIDSDIVRAAAEATNMPFVNQRWLGGMLTNHNTIGGRIKHLKDLEAKMASGELSNKYAKLEVQRFQEEID